MRSGIRKGVWLLLLAAALVFLSPASLAEEALYELPPAVYAEPEGLTELEPTDGDAPSALIESREPAPEEADGETGEAALDAWEEDEPVIVEQEAAIPDPYAVSVFVQAVLDGELRLRLLIGLPAAADPAQFHITANFGGEITVDRALSADVLADGLYILDDAAKITLDRLTEPVYVTLTAGGNSREFSFTAFDYLRMLPAYATAPKPPENRSAWTGGIDGVSGFYARVDLSGGAPAIVFYFRAGYASDLSFRDSAGHSFSGPKRENDGIWSVRVTGLRACELPGDLVIKVSRGAEEATIQYSPLCWAAAHWDERDIPFIALCRAVAAVA